MGQTFLTQLLKYPPIIKCDGYRIFNDILEKIFTCNPILSSKWQPCFGDS